MIAALKSEFRKLLTVRSTYLITAIALVFVMVLSFLVFGYKVDSQALANPKFVQEQLYTVISTFVTAVAIMSILLFVHEYRYATINYTLTLARSRLQVLLAKVVVLLTYITIAAVVVLGLTYAASQLGLAMKDATLVPQQLPSDMIWHFLFYIWGYVFVGSIIAVLVRSVVGAIVTFFLVPVGEQLLSLLLKGNTKYLPFRSLEAVVSTGTPAPGAEILSHTAGLGVFCVYLAILGGTAAWLFVHRDAN